MSCCIDCDRECEPGDILCQECCEHWEDSAAPAYRPYIIPVVGAGRKVQVRLNLDLVELLVRGGATTAHVNLTYRQAVRLAQKLLYLAGKTPEAEE